MEYYANFAAQQTQLMHDIVGKNKRQITKDIREIAAGNRHAGNKASWYVYHKDGENPICDASVSLMSKASTIVCMNTRATLCTNPTQKQIQQ